MSRYLLLFVILLVDYHITVSVSKKLEPDHDVVLVLGNIHVLQVLLLDVEAVIVLERHLLEQFAVAGLDEASADGAPAPAGFMLQFADLANIA